MRLLNQLFLCSIYFWIYSLSPILALCLSVSDNDVTNWAPLVLWDIMVKTYYHSEG